MSAVPSPVTTAEALGMVRAGLGFLATADAAQMAAGEQARCLHELERFDAMGTAARAAVLSAFTSAQGYTDDACYSARSWLIHQTRITKGAAAGHVGWSRRADTGRRGGHPDSRAALPRCAPGCDAASGGQRDAAGAGRAAGEGVGAYRAGRFDGAPGQLGARLGGPSLPLDIGVSENVPAGIRNAILLRDRRCRWPGGCNQPAAACQVHHVRHKKHGGKTSVKDCILLCWHHHQVMIHREGWTLVLNPDGTTMAWNKDKTKVLRSHSPPSRPG